MLSESSTEDLQRELAAERELERQGCEASLWTFVQMSWAVLEPGTELADNWHLQLFCEWLEEVSDGKVRKLIINVPPRSLKSTIATICWPVWQWLRASQKRFMFASYSQALSTEHSIARRQLIESPWFQQHWGAKFRLLDDSNQKHHFVNDKRGGMMATSPGGSATGFGCDVLVIDDPHNTKQAESEAERTSTLNDIDKGLMTRFNDPKKGIWVLVMQRLHEDDYTGHVLKKKYPDLVHVKLPTIAELDETIVFPRSRKVVRRRVGDLLHANRNGPDDVAEAKKTLGSFGFAGQHQQNPAPLAGGLLKVANWQRYKEAPTQFDEVVLSWDMRFKRTTSEQSKSKGDYVVGVCLGSIGSRTYLLDLVRGLWGFKDSRDALSWMSKRWPQAVAKYVENKANGPGIVDALEDEIPGLTLVEPKGDKLQRVLLTVPYHEALNLYIPEDGHVFSSTGIGGAEAATVGEFVQECAMFPKGAHDDQVDAYTQGILEIYDSGLGYLRRMATL